MKNNKTKITFEYENTEYTLEYTADSLKKMQNMGFNFGAIDEKILTVGEDLFCGAFIANHSNVMRKKRVEIYHAVGEQADGEALVDVLMEMVNEAVDEINYHEGNTKWEVKR